MAAASSADFALPIRMATSSAADASRQVWRDLEALGIGAAEVCDQLEREGVGKFIDSWEQLLGTVSAALDSARAGA